MTAVISLEELIKSGAHFGHQSKRWNPKMATYLYGVKDGVHIFDLMKTKQALEEVLDELKMASKEGKTILFLGTKKQAKDKIEEVARETGSFWVNERWLGGTLTNYDQIKKSIRKLKDLKEKSQKGDFGEYTKKERLLIDREIQRLERFFGGIADMEKEPDILVIVDTKKEIGAVKEAKMKDVEVVGIVDSNSDPSMVDYPIPMNDDATKALEYVLDLMKEAILTGKGKTATKEKPTKDAKKSKSKSKTKKVTTNSKKAKVNLKSKKLKNTKKTKSKTKAKKTSK